jgi:Cu2+-exporting ATPase
MANKLEQFPVTGMSCASCAIQVEKTVAGLQGVKNASVNYANQQLQVEYDTQQIKPAFMKNAVLNAGYDLLLETENALEKQEEIQHLNYLKLKRNFTWAAILTFPVFIIGMFFMHMPYGNEIMLVLSTPVIFYFGKSFFINAVKQAKHGTANMDSLVALSTGIAWLFSVFNIFFASFWISRGLEPHVYFEAAAVVIVFIMLGRLLEERAKYGTSKSIKALMGLQVKTLRVLRNQEEIQIPIEEVLVNDLVIIKSGEKIPVDGIVLDGDSYVDESMLSGEPVAVSKSKGDKVFAGTINQKGSFRFKAEKVGAATLLAQIVKMVQEAQGSKAPVQKLVDKVAGVFVPVVIFIAIVSFFAWYFLGGDNGFTQGLMAMVTVLVIACPCALGLATPTAIMVGVGKGAENGILIKDAESLETAKSINAIILDKTGTITEGKSQVVNSIWLKDDIDYPSILVAIEKRSEHPLADAVVSSFSGQNLIDITLQNFESLTGKGVKAKVNQEEYFVGSPKLVSDLGLTIPQNINSVIQDEGNTIIYFTSKTEIIAVLAIADKIKETSKQAIHELIADNIEVYMLTGDAKATAKSVAASVGIRNYQAELLPADKAAFVEKLQAEGKTVAMVGDGINDSHALAQANVSIAMAKGSDIAIDVAGITLITSDLRKIPQAIHLSKKTVLTIKQNLFWAFIYNLIGIPIAAGLLYPINGFLLNPMIAGAAMALSSVSVVLNSLRLKMTNI